MQKKALYENIMRSVFNSKIKIYTFYTFLLKFKIMQINNIE